jgi:hypothetical protein
MSATLASITFDCRDAVAQADFWAAVLDRPVDPNASKHFSSIGFGGADGPAYLFIRVPERKTAKNRCHLDVVATDRAAEVARLVALGASSIREVEEWGHSWTVMLDPEGNEFCVAEATH